MSMKSFRYDFTAKEDEKISESLFALQDKYGGFSLGLYDIIKCILGAEAAGLLPKLDDDSIKRLNEILEQEER